MPSTSNYHSESNTSALATLNDLQLDDTEDAARNEALPEEKQAENVQKAVGNIIETRSSAIVTGRPTSGSRAGSETKNGRRALPPVEIDLGGTNWTGLLLEYRNVHPEEKGPTYNEDTVTVNSFSCTVSIGECPSAFGVSGPKFRKKKDAKQYASKLAIEWLIRNFHMPDDGSVSFPKARPAPAAATNPGKAAVESGSSGESLGQKIVKLCNELGLPPPTYVITPLEDFGSICSGYAHFGTHLISNGKIGEVENIFGKKSARTECMKKVLEYLQVKMDKEGGDRPAVGEKVEGNNGGDGDSPDIGEK